jgi:hypothetical protein
LIREIKAALEFEIFLPPLVQRFEKSKKQKLITKSSKKVHDHSNEFSDVFFFWLAILGVFGNSVIFSEEF